MRLLRTLQLGNGLNRRQLLKALGLGVAASPLLPNLNSWAADPIRRLVLLFSSSGVVPEVFNPTGSETSWNFPAGGILEPLNRHKADMIFMKGLARGAGGGGGHEQSMGGLWTGNSCKSSVAQAATVDQIIAKAIPKVTDFQSFPFGVMCFYAGEGDITSKIKNNNPYMIHAGPAQKIASEQDPVKVYDKLFAGVNMGGVGDTMVMDQVRAEKRSIIDALKEDMADVSVKVAREDKLKIDAHLEAIRDIERRLQPGGAKMIGAIPKPDGTIALDRSANYPKLIPVMNSLMIAALASDRTRIASMQYSRGFSQIRHTWVGAKDAHHTISHMAGEKVILAAIQRWYAERFAELFDGFKKVADQGKTLMDNTLFVYSNELALGWTHGCSPAATWWATGAAGKLQGTIPRTNRYLDYSDGSGDYNQMLVTMAHAMGATTVNRIGDFTKKEGPLSNVLG
jgi:hypothetical protein